MGNSVSKKNFPVTAEQASVWEYVGEVMKVVDAETGDIVSRRHEFEGDACTHFGIPTMRNDDGWERRGLSVKDSLPRI